MAFKRIRLGIFPKLLAVLLALSVTPLIILGYLANDNLAQTGARSLSFAKKSGEHSLEAVRLIGDRAISDSVTALDEKSTEAIELRTVELAWRIADFLYERDLDISLLAARPPTAQFLLAAYKSLNREVIVPGPWPRQKAEQTKTKPLSWENTENQTAWRRRPPFIFKKRSIPLYKEITFLDLKGRERIKIAHGRVSRDLRDVSLKSNTYCKAEDYFPHLPALQRGRIYVSRVIGAYKKGWLEKTQKGMKVRPESAYAGKENPGGKPYEGLVRWATPVYKGNRKIGYLTMALDHIHIMEFTDHLIPTDERFTDLSDGGSGNYAFLWDNEGRCISHPRDFFICGFDPKTGMEAPGWVSQETYDKYLKSGKDFQAFVAGLTPFSHYTLRKKGSSQQAKKGEIPLDCRVLDTAPQCQGWHRGSEDGGSGSFLIVWSGLRKLTTYAAVPYYTGRYGKSKRGFGYVTIGANVEDFHRAANLTKSRIEAAIIEQGKRIESSAEKKRELISQSVRNNRNIITTVTAIAALAVFIASIMLGITITRPIKRLTKGAQAIGRGDYNQNIEVATRDEIETLANTFNSMARSVAEVDMMKSEFVTIASHELRTPIHSMLLAVSGILEGYSGKIGPEVREDLELVDQGIKRLRALVDNLLDLSRIESRKTELVLTNVDAGLLAERASGEVSELLAAHSHTLSLKKPAVIPLAEMDENRIQRALINILSNSIKYTPDGGQIIFEVLFNNHSIIFQIADNGYGIPSWAKERIFEKFFQADSIMSQKVGGSGLGLTITKGIVEEHCGTIEFQSPLPTYEFPELKLGDSREGTVFRITLPIKQAGNPTHEGKKNTDS